MLTVVLLLLLILSLLHRQDIVITTNEFENSVSIPIPLGSGVSFKEIRDKVLSPVAHHKAHLSGLRLFPVLSCSLLAAKWLTCFISSSDLACPAYPGPCSRVTKCRCGSALRNPPTSDLAVPAPKHGSLPEGPG